MSCKEFRAVNATRVLVKHKYKLHRWPEMCQAAPTKCSRRPLYQVLETQTRRSQTGCPLSSPGETQDTSRRAGSWHTVVSAMKERKAG